MSCFLTRIKVPKSHSTVGFSILIQLVSVAQKYFQFYNYNFYILTLAVVWSLFSVIQLPVLRCTRQRFMLVSRFCFFMITIYLFFFIFSFSLYCSQRVFVFLNNSRSSSGELVMITVSSNILIYVVFLFSIISLFFDNVFELVVLSIIICAPCKSRLLLLNHVYVCYSL